MNAAEDTIDVMPHSGMGTVNVIMFFWIVLLNMRMIIQLMLESFGLFLIIVKHKTERGVKINYEQNQ